MNPVLIAFVGVLLLPLFLASWRLSLLGLAAQGLLMASIRYQLAPIDGAAAWIQLFDLVVVRAIVTPIALYAVLLAQRVPPRNDVLSPNLMSWSLAVALVLLAFRFADRLVPIDGADHDFVASAAAALLLGLLVLATQTGPFSQIIGALRIENAIAMLEVSSAGGGLAPDADPVLQLAQIAVLLGTVLMFRWYLRTLPRTVATRQSAVDGLDL